MASGQLDIRNIPICNYTYILELGDYNILFLSYEIIINILELGDYN